jgi:SAM-dependent methyltransferase
MKDGGQELSTPLTEPEFWRRRHLQHGSRHPYPRPSKRLLDFELNATFQRHLRELRGRRLVEVGCGSSVWLPYFAKEFAMEVYGLDYLPEALAGAQRILAMNQTEGTVFAADVFDLPSSHHGRYDVVFSLGLLEHFSNTSYALSVFARLAAPGGLILTWVPNTSGWIAAASEKICRSFRGIYTRLDLALLVQIHQDLGLRVIEARYTQFLDFTLLAVLSLPRLLKEAAGAAFRLSNRPLLRLARRFPIQSQRFSAGIVIVAKKNDADD